VPCKSLKQSPGALNKEWDTFLAKVCQNPNLVLSWHNNNSSGNCSFINLKSFRKQVKRRKIWMKFICHPPNNYWKAKYLMHL
jgi:hypothetical protein